jgi:hypothetical protein
LRDLLPPFRLVPLQFTVVFRPDQPVRRIAQRISPFL